MTEQASPHKSVPVTLSADSVRPQRPVFGAEPLRERISKRVRLSPQAWTYAMQVCLIRQNGTCVFCPSFPTELDHIDGNSANNDPRNHRALCKSCNVRQRNLQYSADSAKVRERSDSGDAWTQVDHLSESDIRRTGWPAYKKRILERLLTDKRELTWTEAQYRLSYKIVASTTADKYLHELDHEDGPIESKWRYPAKGRRYRVIEIREGRYWNEAETGP